MMNKIIEKYNVMNKILFSLIVLLYGVCNLSGQSCTAVEFTQDGKKVVLNLTEIRMAYSYHTGSDLLVVTNKTKYRVSEPIDTVLSKCNTYFHKVTDQATGNFVLVNELYLSEVRPRTDGLTDIVLSQPRYSFRITDDYTTVAALITACTGGSGGGDISFDSNRPILRTYAVGVNIGGSTVQDALEYMYFVAPTITTNLTPSTTVYEIGTSNGITISGATTNGGGSTLSNGALTRTVPASNQILSFGSNTSYTTGITYTPQQGGSGDYNQSAYTFQASQDWVSGSESGTATSSRSISSVYPVLHGMSAVDLSAGGDPYTTLTKLVQAEGNKTVVFTGTNEFMYYLVPKTWGDFDIATILDHNGFDVTGSFTAFDVTVSSSGLVNDWTNQDYKLYKLNNITTATDFAYQFIR